MFLMMSANSFIDVALIFSMVENICGLTGTEIGTSAAQCALSVMMSALMLGSYYMLVEVARRDPRLLIQDEDEWRPASWAYSSEKKLVELPADVEQRAPFEMFVKEENTHCLQAESLVELPGDAIVKEDRSTKKNRETIASMSSINTRRHSISSIDTEGLRESIDSQRSGTVRNEEGPLLHRLRDNILAFK